MGPQLIAPAAGRFRLIAVGASAVLVIAGSVMSWISFAHIGSLQVVVDQSGIELGYGLVTVACGFGLGLLTVQAARGGAMSMRVARSLAGATLTTLAATVALVMLRPAGSYAEHGPAVLVLGIFVTGLGAWTAALATLRLPLPEPASRLETALVEMALGGWGVLLVGAFVWTLLAFEPVNRQGMLGTAFVVLALLMGLVLFTESLLDIRRVRDR
jgi:hypothetical protein